jgi:hypothetical protein
MRAGSTKPIAVAWLNGAHGCGCGCYGCGCGETDAWQSGDDDHPAQAQRQE